MTGILADVRHLKFVLFELLKVHELTGEKDAAHLDRDTMEMLIDEAIRFSEKCLYPLNIANDKIGAKYENGEVRAVPGMQEAWREFVQSGWLTMSESPEVGGQGLPEILKFATHELFLAANFPFMCYVNLTHDAAKLIELFGNNYQRETYMMPMYSGEWTGTMCLTEPGAGSDVGALKTRARLVDDGSYRIKGQKIYITNGEHDLAENIIHLVLARIEGDPKGTRGLSLFVVPKRQVNSDGSLGPRNDVHCLGIEHKMGLHASPTATLAFGDNDECCGYLLGEPRAGIKIMFHMMNQSRLEVGLFGLGTSSMAYRHALSYAIERRQGQGYEGEKEQVPILEHPDVRRNLMTMKSYTEGMRALLYYCGFAMDRAAMTTHSDEATKWQDIVDLLIPIAKAIPTEKGVELSSLGMQIYGGAGYTTEYPIEQFLRDSKVACIFEGTTGIQGIDFALRKVAMKNGAVYRDFLTAMDDVIDCAAQLQKWERYSQQLRKTRDMLLKLPAKLAAVEESQRVRYQLLTATPFMEAVGDLMIGYFLLWQALVAENSLSLRGDLPVDIKERNLMLTRDPETAFFCGQLDVARYFIANVLPQVDGKIASLEWQETAASEICEASF